MKSYSVENSAAENSYTLTCTVENGISNFSAVMSKKADQVYLENMFNFDVAYQNRIFNFIDLQIFNRF